jgi:hypothetical protein
MAGRAPAIYATPVVVRMAGTRPAPGRLSRGPAMTAG